jgi:hypothetical protein
MRPLLLIVWVDIDGIWADAIRWDIGGIWADAIRPYGWWGIGVGLWADAIRP